MLERIRSACKAKGLSVTQLEKELGYGNGSIGKWANGAKSPPYDRVAAIANFLGVTPEWLVTGEDRRGKGDLLTAIREVDDLGELQELWNAITAQMQEKMAENKKVPDSGTEE